MLPGCKGLLGKAQLLRPEWLMRKLRIRAAEVHTQKLLAKAVLLGRWSLPAQWTP